MEDYRVVFSLGILLSLIAISVPGMNYLKLREIASSIPSPSLHADYPHLTILLPVKNESLVIKQKLEEISEMNYQKSKISILLIDSKSEDNTVKIANKYLTENEDIVDWKIEVLQRPGKSAAVNHALDIMDTEFFVMMDTEAMLQKNSLELIMRWFQNSEIGAVCGMSEVNHKISDYSYRSRFNIMRIGESVIDSTPIFEGSICAFRVSSLKSKTINPGINADDSQLAIIVRRNGFKALMDPEVRFSESNSQTKNMALSRKVRRAQGLSRVLWMNRDICASKEGKYSRIFMHQLYFYLFFPWILFFSNLCIILSISLQSFNYYGYEPMTLLYLFPLFLAFRYYNPFASFYQGIYVLLKSHILLLFGKKLNIWDTDQELRQSINDRRNNSY